MNQMQMDMTGGLPNGSLPGHLLPGVIFLLWGLVWLMDLVRGREGGGALESRAPVRLAKLVLPFVGIVGELSHGGLFRNWSLNNLQHATMYSAFALSAAVDMLAARGRLPGVVTYHALAFASLVAGLLFLAHPNHGPLATTVHHLIVVLFFALSATAAREGAARARGTAWLRTGLMLTLGTWFIQVGFSLHGPGAEPMDPQGRGSALLLFSWHLLSVATLLGVLAAVRRRPPGGAGI